MSPSPFRAAFGRARIEALAADRCRAARLTPASTRACRLFEYSAAEARRSKRSADEADLECPRPRGLGARRRDRQARRLQAAPLGAPASGPGRAGESAGSHDRSSSGQPNHRRRGAGIASGSCPRRTVIRIRAGRIEAAAAVALYGVYELVRGLRRRGLDGGPPAHGRHRRRSSARSGSSGSRASRPRRSPSRGWRGSSASSTSRLHFAATIAFLVLGPSPSPGRVRDACGRRSSSRPGSRSSATSPSRPRRRASPASASPTPSRRARGVNLSSDLLGALYNPVAAVPSLHFGYALLVGAGLAVLARRRWVQDRRRAVPRRDAVHHRRDRQSLLRRRGARRRGRRRGAGRWPGRSSASRRAATLERTHAYA